MDLRSYYKKVKEAEATLKMSDVVLVSLATSEGGKDGVFTEAPRTVAAKLIAEGRARAATTAEAREFRDGLRAGQEKFQQDEAARTGRHGAGEEGSELSNGTVLRWTGMHD